LPRDVVTTVVSRYVVVLIQGCTQSTRGPDQQYDRHHNHVMATYNFSTFRSRPFKTHEDKQITFTFVSDDGNERRFLTYDITEGNF
jgi:hypothetical protein